MSVSESQNVSLMSTNISQSNFNNSEVESPKILNILSKIKSDFERTFEESYLTYNKHF